MKRTDFTYSQLDKTLRALGFACHPGTNDPPGRIYEHSHSGAIIMLPAYSDTERVYEHHLAAAISELESFGIAAPSVFTAKLRRAG